MFLAKKIEAAQKCKRIKIQKSNKFSLVYKGPNKTHTHTHTLTHTHTHTHSGKGLERTLQVNSRTEDIKLVIKLGAFCDESRKCV